MRKKKLVVYFSYSGHTKKIIDKIKEQIDCDVLKIKTLTPYSTDYNSVANDEQNSERSNFLSEI